MTGFSHVCFAVDDLEAAMRDLNTTLGVQWGDPRAERMGPWPFRIVFTTASPHIELIEGSAGSPWDTAATGPRFDHLGRWASDLDQASRRFSAAGHAVDVDGCPFGRSFAYHRVDSIGARVELVDIVGRPAFQRTWSGDDAPGPAHGAGETGTPDAQ